MTRRNYVIELDHDVNIEEALMIRKQVGAALRRGQPLITEPGIKIRDLGPVRPTIRLADAERWLTA